MSTESYTAVMNELKAIDQEYKEKERIRIESLSEIVRSSASSKQLESFERAVKFGWIVDDLDLPTRMIHMSLGRSKIKIYRNGTTKRNTLL